MEKLAKHLEKQNFDPYCHTEYHNEFQMNWRFKHESIYEHGEMQCKLINIYLRVVSMEGVDRKLLQFIMQFCVLLIQ